MVFLYSRHIIYINLFIFFFMYVRLCIYYPVKFLVSMDYDFLMLLYDTDLIRDFFNSKLQAAAIVTFCGGIQLV